ncbi:MAG: Shedu anti-phage system protein SduA domain-containing protein, partial [Candidatus Saccharimonadales bacterium]
MDTKGDRNALTLNNYKVADYADLSTQIARLLIVFDDYLDLTNSDFDLDSIRIESKGFDCNILDTDDKQYKGFILAKSQEGNAFTLCDVDFQWSDKDKKYPPRLIFRRTNAELADKAVRKDQVFQRISFETGHDGYREFWKMIAFLSKFKELVDLGEFFDSYQVVSAESVVIHLKQIDLNNRKKEIVRYAKDSEVSTSEMAELFAHRARKDDLETFRKLLENESGFRATYRTQFQKDIKGAGEEPIWHHFLSQHRWIFGLSLDLRFIEDFIDEASVGNPDTANKGNPQADMLGYSDYTVLIELKTPDTDIFTAIKTSDARANTWSFTTPFIEGFSQCLAQKTDWGENYKSKSVIVEKDGKRTELDKGVIRTIDPQAIYIVGNKDREIPQDSADTDIRLKRDTLERFIRNNRNVNIISYDELYRRAYHIVYGDSEPPELKTVEAESIEDHDIP